MLRNTLLSFDFYGQIKAVMVIFLFTWIAWAITRFPPYRNPQVSDLLVILFFSCLSDTGFIAAQGDRMIRPRRMRQRKRKTRWNCLTS